MIYFSSGITVSKSMSWMEDIVGGGSTVELADDCMGAFNGSFIDTLIGDCTSGLIGSFIEALVGDWIGAIIGSFIDAAINDGIGTFVDALFRTI